MKIKQNARGYFKDKIAIVTGGGSGIGAELCKGLAEAGATVVIADINENAARQIMEEVLQKGGKALAQRVDVSDAIQVVGLMSDTATRFGRLDFMFNNAGVSTPGEAHEFTPALWQKAVSINLTAVAVGCSEAFSIMKQQPGGGHIVNTSSAAGLLVLPKALPYNSTKTAVVSLSRNLRLEGYYSGVRVSCACPGFVETAFFDNAICKDSNCASRKKLGVKFMTAEQAAAKILEGVATNRGLIIFPFYVKIMWWATRCFYPLVEWLTLCKMRKM